MGNLLDTHVVGAPYQLNGDNRAYARPKAPALVNIEERKPGPIVVRADNVSFFYGTHQALRNIDLTFEKNRVTCLIGPSGCGKSTFLRAINRMNDRIPGARLEGTITVDGEDVHSKKMDLMELRRRVGMVFQKPNPFPATIFENVAMAPRLHYGLKGRDSEELVQESLVRAALWDEVKDNLKKSALALSGGQQQRLCIARALAVQPEIILMDEPCSALDPISTYKVEELIRELAQDYTLIVVTHNMHQAARISNCTAFFMLGKLVEVGPTDEIFQRPQSAETEAYVSGRFG